MKIILKMIGIAFFVIIGLFVILLIILKIESSKPMVEESYWKEVQTGGDIEAKYMRLGSSSVKCIKFDIKEERWSNITIWYPEELETSNQTFPLIVMANGTGVQDFKYEPVFEHLVSWGFIVISNDDPSSGLGDSSAKSLDYILELNNQTDSVFYHKIDGNNIGIAGHSQGGVSTIHAVYNFENSDRYKAAYTASATTETMIESWNLADFEYDISKVNIPILMVAGTGETDGNTISPLEDMKKNFQGINGSAMIARRKNADHGEMLYMSNSYMIAWFRYHLMNDEEAKKAFVGENAEISNNKNWQNVQSKGLY